MTHVRDFTATDRSTSPVKKRCVMVLKEDGKWWANILATGKTTPCDKGDSNDVIAEKLGLDSAVANLAVS